MCQQPCRITIKHLRVSRAVSTPHVCTFGAITPTAQEEDLRPIGFQTLAACPPDSLPDFLVDQLLLLRWSHDHYRLYWSGGIRVRPNSCVSGPFPKNLVLPFAVYYLLGLGPPGWKSRALAAEVVIAFLADPSPTNLASAQVTLSMDTHAYRPVYAEHVAFHLIEVTRVYLQRDRGGLL